MVVASCRRLAESEAFQSFILFLVLLSAGVMGLETVPEVSHAHGDALFAFTWLAQAVFAFEIAVRLTAHAPKVRTFFDDSWNTFDFVVVVVSFLPAVGSFALVARLLRVVRVLRVVSVSDKLRDFAGRLPEAADELAYAVLISFVFGYGFTLAGHTLFSEADPARWGTFGGSALSVFYLLLLQDVPAFVGPALEHSSASIAFFLVLYLSYFGLFFCALNAAIAQSLRGPPAAPSPPPPIAEPQGSQP